MVYVELQKGGRGLLLKFSASNFKSIGKNIEFSMFPVRENEDTRFLTEIDTKKGKWKILRRGGFFGPNASGKTNFIRALRFMCQFVSKSRKFDTGTGVTQFRTVDSGFDGISAFNMLFYLNGEVYEYGFAVDIDSVVEEWLFILTENGMSPLYTRKTEHDGKTSIDVEDRFAEKGTDDRLLIDILKNSVKEEQRNQLFIYKLADNGISSMSEIVKWFGRVMFISPKTKIKALPFRMKEDKDFTEYVGETLKKLDTGVYKVTTETKHVNFLKFAESMRLPRDVVDEIQKERNGIIDINGQCFIFSRQDKRDTILVEIKFEHRLYGKKVMFDLSDESDGTKRVLDLLPMLFFVNEDDCVIYCVDEIDRSLHTKLSRYILSEFVNGAAAKNIQIVFTAHDVNLINLNYFRQEEIWFIEKNSNGESRIRPLSDFDIAKDVNLVKDYLAGRFGAVPVIREDV